MIMREVKRSSGMQLSGMSGVIIALSEMLPKLVILLCLASMFKDQAYAETRTVKVWVKVSHIWYERKWGGPEIPNEAPGFTQVSLSDLAFTHRAVIPGTQTDIQPVPGFTLLPATLEIGKTYELRADFSHLKSGGVEIFARMLHGDVCPNIRCQSIDGKFH